MNWVGTYWKDLTIVLLVVVLIGTSVNSCIVGNRAIKYEGLYIRTYEELVVAERALRLKGFEDYSTMEAWVHNWVRKKFISLTGIVDTVENTLNYLLTGSYLWVCSDIAEEMVRSARMEGYLVSECLVDGNGKVYGITVSKLGNHSGCLAHTDGYYWYIEPQTGSIVRITSRYETGN